MAGSKCDIYGQIWNDFKIVDGKPFLSSEDTLARYWPHA